MLTWSRTSIDVGRFGSLTEVPLGGAVQFSTGNLTSTGGSPSNFFYTFGPGGCLSLAGILGPDIPLLTGTFAGPSTLTFSGDFATFTGLLNITSISPPVADRFGFNLPPTEGFLTF